MSELLHFYEEVYIFLNGKMQWCRVVDRAGSIGVYIEWEDQSDPTVKGKLIINKQIHNRRKVPTT